MKTVLSDSLAFARTFWRACLLLSSVVLLATPSSARASLLADRLEISMYGRVGLAWSPTTGRFIQGKTFNLTGSSIGGRLEEGDYLEPTIRFHLLEKSEDPAAAYAQVVITPSLYTQYGLLAGAFANRFSDPLTINLFQAYVEAGNMLLPGLKIWAGQRFYRGTDVHIADLYYFNNLSGQGAGVAYGPLDVAVLMQTSLTGGQYNFDVDGDGRLDVRRQRTVVVGQYVQKLEAGHSLHLLGELHLLPGVQARVGDRELNLDGDFGWVAGIKGRLSLPNEGFNDVSVRYGSRLASGSRAGAQTWDTFGVPDPVTQLYGDAAGVQVVDHFLYNFSPLFSLNAYGILHWNQGLNYIPPSPTPAQYRSLDFAVGARSTLYLHDQFHLINEATFQGLRQGEGPMSTAVKLTIMPTIVPSGVRSVWARPHLRLFYTIAFYDRDAVNGLVSPYLQTVGPESVGHYIGTRVEWWF